MKVVLARRWGPHPARKTVDVDEVQAAWLIQHSYAQSAGDIHAPVQPAAAEGMHGADPLAGADATRLRPRVPRSTGSTASQAAGSSPTYRAGFDADAAARQGVAGRNYVAPSSDEKKPARRKSSRSSS